MVALTRVIGAYGLPRELGGLVRVRAAVELGRWVRRISTAGLAGKRKAHLVSIGPQHAAQQRDAGDGEQRFRRW